MARRQTCFFYAQTRWRACVSCNSGHSQMCAICLFEEQRYDACRCEDNIAAIRGQRLNQLRHSHRVHHPAPDHLPAYLSQDWNAPGYDLGDLVRDVGYNQIHFALAAGSQDVKKDFQNEFLRRLHTEAWQVMPYGGDQLNAEEPVAHWVGPLQAAGGRKAGIGRSASRRAAERDGR